MKPKISVVVTTYNGIEFIERQLDSIRLQTLNPDEVIISDDHSSDNTFDVIEQYIKEYKLTNWLVYSNKDNKGWIDNFHFVISKASGDYVFFSDQDDIWVNDKIEKMVLTMEANINIQVLSCSTLFIDGVDNEIKVSDRALPFGEVNKHVQVKESSFNKKFAYSIRPGCTMCVKSDLIKKVYSIRVASQIPHDALFWKVGILLRGAFVLNEPLVKYRIHDHNVSQPNVTTTVTIKTKDQRKEEAEVFYNQLVTIREIYKELENDKEYENDLQSIVLFCEWRVGYFDKPNFFEAITKIPYYRSLRMYIGDLISVINR